MEEELSGPTSKVKDPKTGEEKEQVRSPAETTYLEKRKVEVEKTRDFYSFWKGVGQTQLSFAIIYVITMLFNTWPWTYQRNKNVHPLMFCVAAGVSLIASCSWIGCLEDLVFR